MTLCLPSNRLFDNKPAVPSLHVSTAEGDEDARCSNRKRGMWCHTQGFVGEQAARPGEWEPLIFIHDREKVLVCWHRLLHLHSVIDCLPQRGSSVYLQIDEPVLLTPFLCHPVMLPHKKTLQSSPYNRPVVLKHTLSSSGTVSWQSTAQTQRHYKSQLLKKTKFMQQLL